MRYGEGDFPHNDQLFFVADESQPGGFLVPGMSVTTIGRAALDNTHNGEKEKCVTLDNHHNAMTGWVITLIILGIFNVLLTLHINRQ